MNANAQPARSEDQRANERIAVTLEAKLFLPAEGTTLDCTVVNLSAGGAKLYCPETAPPDASVVLYINGFGRFEGVTTRFVKGELGVQFVCRDAKRKRLEQDLTAFINEGMMGVTRLRRYPRAAASTGIRHFINAAGESVACEVLDISFQGALLKTAVRPAIGEIIQLGQTRGWVVRHHEQGVGVQFQQRFEPGAAE